MADFERWVRQVLDDEGGYSRDPQDPGGETIFGIARKKRPDWPGWRGVDELRAAVGFPQNAEQDAALLDSAKQFYRAEYWIKVRGDELIDERLAGILFSCAANCGPEKAVELLQQALNILKPASVRATKVDGDFGPDTQRLLLGFPLAVAEGALPWLVSCLWTDHYVALVGRNPTLGRFVRGWIARVARFWA